MFVRYARDVDISHAYEKKTLGSADSGARARGRERGREGLRNQRKSMDTREIKEKCGDEGGGRRPCHGATEPTTKYKRMRRVCVGGGGQKRKKGERNKGKKRTEQETK